MEKIFLILMMIFISSCDGAIKNIQNQRKTAETSARQSLSKANEAIVMAEKELQEHDELMAFLNCTFNNCLFISTNIFYVTLTFRLH